MPELRRNVPPRDHERCMSRIDDVPHERVLRPQVENVVLVDARRHEEKRCLVDCGGRRRILDQLDQLIAEHHAARRERQVAADLECRFVGHRDAPALRVADQVREPLGDAGAARLDCELERFGIRRQEIRWRDGIRVLARQEPDAFPGFGIALRQCGEFPHVVGVQQIGVSQPGEVRVLAPLFPPEAAIRNCRLSAGCCRRRFIGGDRALPESLDALVVASGELGRGSGIDPGPGRCKHRQRSVAHFERRRGGRHRRRRVARPPVAPLLAHRLPLAQELGPIVRGRMRFHRRD